MTELTYKQQEEAAEAQLEAELWPEEADVYAPPRPKYWLHLLLFTLTFLMAAIVGARMQDNFLHHRPLFIGDQQYLSLKWLLEDLSRLKMGLPFASSLLGILLAHELGHYLLCLRYGVNATLPFFIPAPIPAGTFGAFIQIRSPFRSRNDLFDIAIGGPIAGFIVAVPVAAWGLAHSLPITQELDSVSIKLGTPQIFHYVYSALQWMGQAPVKISAHDLYYHPVAIAAWVGMLATMLNLLPGGQLDGGHIIQALTQKWHLAITWAAITVMLVLSWYLWTGWLIWAIFLYVSRRHPEVPQEIPLGTFRKAMALVAVGLLVITFMPVPATIEGNTLHELFSALWNLFMTVFDWVVHIIRQ